MGQPSVDLFNELFSDEMLRELAAMRLRDGSVRFVAPGHEGNPVVDEWLTRITELVIAHLETKTDG